MPLLVEVLERRLLLAVTVELKGSTLVVTGDDDGDLITFYGGADTGDVIVQVDVGPFTPFQGVKNIKLDLGGGDDAVSVSSVDIDGSFTVNLGEGDNSFSIVGDGSRVGKNLKYTGGDGIDTFNINAGNGGAGTPPGRIEIGRSLNLNLGGGSNVATIQTELAGQEMAIGKNVIVTAGDSGDVIVLDGISVGRNVKVSTRGGGDVVAFGDDSAVAGSIGGGVKISLGADSDVFAGTNFTLSKKLGLDGGDGDDTAANEGAFVVQGKLKVKHIETDALS